MATPPTPTSGALTVNSTTGVILSPVTAALFRSANGIGTGTGDVTASGTLTANALILGGGTTVVSASALTYSGTTLSVPDAFSVTSAGSIDLTAGSTGKNISLITGTSGQIIVAGSTTLPTPQAGYTYQLGPFGTIDGVATTPFIQFRRTNTSVASPSAILSGNGLGNFAVKGYMATGYSGSTGAVAFNATQNWTDSANGTSLSFQTTSNGATSATTRLTIENYGKLTHVPAAGSLAAWGVVGSALSQKAATYTDSSSSGTVATAVANSFAVPTFAASSATTFTNAANLYIAGDVAQGTNVTLTNSYGLWNAGKTRLDGVTSITNATAATTITSGALQVTGGISTQNEVYATLLNAISATGASLVRVTSANGFDSRMQLSQSGQRTWYWYIPASSTDMRLRDSSGSVDVATFANTTGNLTLLGSLNLTGAGQITGGAGNMTITAGTGASRTLTLRTTTSGSTATDALTLSATQNATFGGSVTTSTPNGGTAGAWKFGIRVAAVSALDTTQYIQLDVGGTLYRLALVV